MSVKRIMGIETEYGILSPNSDEDPSVLSSQIVHSYSAYLADQGLSEGVRWDYSGEQPLHDARGFVVPRNLADPSQLTDDPNNPAPSGPSALAPGRKMTPVVRLTKQEERWQRGDSTAILNGGRLYVDHAHPEYCSPEVTSPMQAVLYDMAGENIVREAMSEVTDNKGLPEIILYKNNVDGKGATYGCHENYYVDRKVPFEILAKALMPFFVTRPVICGSGRVGIGQFSEVAGYQICQRADYVENTIGLETTFNRPIINTRDEPHADPKVARRLHVIGGDANTFPASTFIKMASTSLVLWVLENYGLPQAWQDLELVDPVAESPKVSHDTKCQHKMQLKDGRQLTAVQIQKQYLEICEKLVAKHGNCDEETATALQLWSRILDCLQEGRLSEIACEVEWVFKLQVMQALMKRENLDWASPKLTALDLQWSDMRAGRGIGYKMVQAKKARTYFTLEQIHQAQTNPPQTTRAYFRGEMIKRFPKEVFAASWHSMVVDTGAEHMVRIPMSNPMGGTKNRIGEVLDKMDTAAQMVEYLKAEKKVVAQNQEI